MLVSDIRMPGGSGIDLLAQVKARHPGLPVIIMTAYSDLDSAVAAFQGGAFDYLPKPFDVPKAVELIRRAVDESLREAVADSAAAEVPEMLGQAPAMQDVFRAIGRLSQSAATVLITGESGSGKELVARALHRHSPRAAGPFVAINTAAIPKDLLESELFGHERGAFTGAQSDAPRPLRAGRRRHAVSRRDRRHAVRPADAAAARARRRPVLPRRRPQPDAQQRARDRRDAPEPRRAGQARACSARTCSTAST